MSKIEAEADIKTSNNAMPKNEKKQKTNKLALQSCNV